MVRMRFHASARRLSGNAAARVDSAELLPAEQLRQWHAELDRMGLRATGSPAHERYIDILVARLERAGVAQVDRMRREAISFTQTVLDLGSVPLVSLSSLDLPRG